MIEEIHSKYHPQKCVGNNRVDRSQISFPFPAIVYLFNSIEGLQRLIPHPYFRQLIFEEFALAVFASHPPPKLWIVDYLTIDYRSSIVKSKARQMINLRECMRDRVNQVLFKRILNGIH